MNVKFSLAATLLAFTLSSTYATSDDEEAPLLGQSTIQAVANPQQKEADRESTIDQLHTIMGRTVMKTYLTNSILLIGGYVLFGYGLGADHCNTKEPTPPDCVLAQGIGVASWLISVPGLWFAAAGWEEHCNTIKNHYAAWPRKY